MQNEAALRLFLLGLVITSLVICFQCGLALSQTFPQAPSQNVLQNNGSCNPTKTFSVKRMPEEILRRLKRLGGADLTLDDVKTEIAQNMSLHCVDLYLEVADTPDKLERGLMDRARLSPQSGMLFDFGQLGSITMWMKNTLIPLDMLFLNDDRVVVYIHADAPVRSIALITCPVLARYVIEINGGEANRLGITEGAQVVFPKEW